MSDTQSEKIVHFIRHGETRANRHHFNQGPDEPLSERGEKQAEAVVPSLRKLGIDTLYCSSLTRARQTASIIGTKLDLPLTIIDEVVEFGRPNYLYKKSHYSFNSLWYVISLFWNQSNPNWNDDGAENLFHIRQRMLNTKRLLEESPGKNIAVVSHAIFMDMFTQAVCADRDLKLTEFMTGLALTKRIPNTGIISFRVDPNAPGQTCKWWLDSMSFNKKII